MYYVLVHVDNNVLVRFKRDRMLKHDGVPSY